MSAGSLGMKWQQRAIPSPWLSITRWTQLPGVQQHSRHVLALLDVIVSPYPLSLSLSFLLCVIVGVAHLTSLLQNNVNKLQEWHCSSCILLDRGRCLLEAQTIMNCQRLQAICDL